MRHLITTIRQAGGGERRLYAPTREAQMEAQEELRRDPATVDALRAWGLVSHIEDVEEKQGGRYGAVRD